MTILIRCNAGPKIGFGHLIRCRALVHAMFEQGEQCVMAGPDKVYATAELAGNSVYVCTEHKPEILQGYREALDPVFALIQECEQGRDINTLLNGPLCHTEFRRLN